jgi:hypothetical protein
MMGPCSSAAPERQVAVSRHLGLILYALAMVALIVGVDVIFFRQHLWARLMVNVGIVLVFIGFYIRFFRDA